MTCDDHDERRRRAEHAERIKNEVNARLRSSRALTENKGQVGDDIGFKEWWKAKVVDHRLSVMMEDPEFIEYAARLEAEWELVAPVDVPNMDTVPPPEEHQEAVD